MKNKTQQHNSIAGWTILFVTFGFCLTFFGWMAYDAFHLSLAGAALVGVCFFLFIFFLLLPSTLKSAIIKQLPDDAALVAACEDDFPLLDKAELQRLTEEFQALGFRPLFDYQMHSPTEKLVPGFGRLMRHAEHGCLVEMNQFFPVGRKAMPLQGGLMSVFGTDEQVPKPTVAAALPPLPNPLHEAPRLAALPWSFSTVTRPPRTIDALCGLPRVMGDRCTPETPAAEMLQRHLAHRAELSTILQQPVFYEMDAERFHAWCAVQRALLKHKVQRTNFHVGLLRAFFLPKNRPFDAARSVAFHRVLQEKFPR